MTAAPTINGKTQTQWKRVLSAFQRAHTVAAALRSLQAECARVVLVYTREGGWFIELSDLPPGEEAACFSCEDLMLGLQRYLDGLANHAPYEQLAESEAQGVTTH